MTDELITWLRGVLDEDERARTHESDCPGDAECICGQPAFVLADIAAKRAILDLHGIIWRDIGWLELDDGELVEAIAELPVCVHCVPRHSHFRTRQGVPEGACQTVRLLASAYASRSGYRPEWAPTSSTEQEQG